MNNKIIKSCLFVPGNSQKMLNKILLPSIKANLFVPDLEDSVPFSKKNDARLEISKFLKDNNDIIKEQNKIVFPRLNINFEDNTSIFDEDLDALYSNLYEDSIKLTKYFDGLIIPKMNDLDQYKYVVDRVKNFEKKINKNNLPNIFLNFIVWFESPKGINNMDKIFEENLKDNRIIAAAFGQEDYLNEMQIKLIKYNDEINNLIVPKSIFSMKCHSYNIIPLDTPTTNFKNKEILEKEISFVKSLGFKGKFAIHPDQLESINFLFDPSIEEVNWALKIKSNFEKSVQENNRGSLDIDGEMVDIPVYKRALNILKQI